MGDRLTFEQFKQTCASTDDLIAALGGDPGMIGRDEPEKVAGNVYVGCLYIERATEASWMLVIGRDCFISDDLGELERSLYDFACGEGFCDVEACHA